MTVDLLTRSKDLFQQIREAENENDQYHAIWIALWELKSDSRTEVIDEFITKYKLEPK